MSLLADYTDPRLNNRLLGAWGGYSLVEARNVCAAPKGMVFESFWSEMGIDFDHFGLK